MTVETLLYSYMQIYIISIDEIQALPMADVKLQV